MKLYGHLTSPFVRRVRAVAAEVGEPVELVNTSTPEGTAELLRIAPIRKVPVAIVDGRDAPLFDSRAIVDWTLARHGRGPLAARDPWDELDRINAIDAALDSMIQLYYLRRQDAAIDDTPYGKRQRDRADAVFAWLDAHVPFGDGIAVAEIALACALDWLVPRGKYPAECVGKNVLALRDKWSERPSLVATRPPE
jgi:glutathione S-transferase